MAGWLGRLLGQGDGSEDCLPDDPAIRALIEAALDGPGERNWDPDPRKFEAGMRVLALAPAEAIVAIGVLLKNHVNSGPRSSGTSSEWSRVARRERLVSELCRRALPFTPETGAALLDRYLEIQRREPFSKYMALVKAIARAAQAGGWLAAVRPQLERTQALLSDSRYAEYADLRKALREIEALMTGGAGGSLPAFRFERDAWGEKAHAAFAALDSAARERLQPLLDYCASAKGSAPSGKWLKAGAEVMEHYGGAAFATLARDWLALLAEPAPKRDDAQGQRRLMVGERNGDLLKGMAWLLVHLPDEETAATLAEAALQAFRKIPNLGARSVKAGNACLHTLKNLPGLSGARRLAALRAAVKLPGQVAAVEKALAECAARLGLSLAETEELATPDHGFVDGRRRLEFGAVTAELALDGGAVSVSWRGADGRAQKSEPVQVKRDFAEARKAMKRLIIDVERTLAAIRDRLERLPLEEREWPFDTWRQRYFDHPVAAAQARRLIWRFRSATGETPALWVGGRWLDESGEPVEVEGTTVAAWHPALATADSVRRWRALLGAQGIVQPFKQAHREIYLLTDAERRTRSYSNRFAAHVLRQHQFASLCIARGWKYRLQGGFDSHNNPTLALPRWKLVAEYWIEAPENESDLAASGIYLHVLTDQLRFAPLGGGEPLALEDVPPLVFSEVMRDVDLFVGVTSVGNDPNWSDGGPEGRYRNYWQAYAFGDLSVAAETRREILAELLPRLTALQGAAHLDGKFLVVKGRRREFYKIHLGSGNILMSPNDQYLCIVPDRSSAKAELHLPFEGDSTLAVILSKAFLLAADDRITDPSITRQIGVE